MNACIIGGGHIGTTLACYIKHTDPDKTVILYTQHPQRFERSIQCNDIEGEISYSVTLDIITDDPFTAVSNADIIFIALPHFAVEGAFGQIAPFIKNGVLIGVLPGGGGCEFFFERYFQDRAILFGAQRVPFIARIVRYGKETNLKSWKPFSMIGTLYPEDLDTVCECVEQCGLRTRRAPNYLCVALTPTNALLHTGRTYEIFSEHSKEYEYPVKKQFYVGWTDRASKILLSMDAELHQLLDAIPEIDTTTIRPLTEHYESHTAEDLTRKINGISAFQAIWAPMIASSRENGTFVADTKSRLFSEDFPYGLAIIRAYFDFFGIAAPTMDQILEWYADYMELEWYMDGSFCGKDLKNTGIPQTYGISTKKELISFYNRQKRHG